MRRRGHRAVLLIGLSMLLGAAGCQRDVQRAQGLVKWTVSALVGFDQIELAGPIDANVVVGKGPNLDIESSSSDRDQLEINIGDGKLSMKLPAQGGRDDEERVRVSIETPELSRLVQRGRGEVTIEGARGPRLDIVVSGASRLELKRARMDNLSLDVAGAADVFLEGETTKLELDLSGAGAIRAHDLKAEVVEVDVSGAGSVRVFASETVTGTLSGVGKVTIAGAPAVRQVKTSGIGEVLFE